GDLVLAVLVGTAAATITGILVHTLGSGTPDERLELPIGYANAAGIVAATALVLALGLASGSARLHRAVAGAAVVPAAAALWLSVSRGSMLAAVLGIVVVCLATASREGLTTIAVAAAPGLGAVGAVVLGGRLQDSGAAAREVLSLAALAGLAAVGGWLAW